jgi:hypothetical protein
VEALLHRFDDIIAVDNDPHMLSVAKAASHGQFPGGTRVLWQEVTAEAFSPPPGWQADLVTIPLARPERSSGPPGHPR